MQKHHLETIQHRLQAQGVLGWLVYDVHFRNKTVLTWLGISPDTHLTRKFFYWVPSVGVPVKIVHAIEEEKYRELEGRTVLYSSKEQLSRALEQLLSQNPSAKKRKIAMEIWPEGEVPSLSSVDHGTIEWLKSFNLEIISSWEIIGKSLSELTNAQLAQQSDTFPKLISAIQKTIASISPSSTDKSLQEKIVQELLSQDLLFDHPPCVALGPDSALPHFSPVTPKKIAPNQLLLIDVWAKEQERDAPYVDLTTVYYLGSSIPEEIKKCYSIVRQAQTAAIDLIRAALASTTPLRGCDVDRAARDVIIEHGLGEYFTHRLGHNITHTLHGPGANFDSFETFDTRAILPGTSYSIEPGIYFPGRWGIRLECTIQITHTAELRIFGAAEQEIALCPIGC